MKVALLISGELREFWYCVDSIVKNLIVPNNVDVFVMTGNNRGDGQYVSEEDESNPQAMSMWPSRQCRARLLEGDNKEALNINEYEFIRKKMGSYLKGMNKSNYIPNYFEEMREICERSRERYRSMYKESERPDCESDWFPVAIYNVLQYLLINKGLELIEEYERKHGIQYDYILKIRPDMVIEGTVDIASFISEKNATIWVPPEHYHRHPNLRYSINLPPENGGAPCGGNVHDYVFLFKRNLLPLMKNFVYEYGTIIRHDASKKEKLGLCIVENQWGNYLTLNEQFKPSSLRTWCHLQNMKANQYDIKGSVYALKFFN